MIVKEFFDVIVVGASIAPLAAGALLARRGLRVLVVGNGGREEEGCRSLLMHGLLSPLVMRVFEELGVTYFVKRRVRRPEPLFQVLLPSARVDVSADPEVLRKEIRREFGRHADTIELMYSMLPEMTAALDRAVGGEFFIPPEGLLERKRVEMLLAKHRPEERFPLFEKAFADARFVSFLRAIAATDVFVDHDRLGLLDCLFLHRRMVEHCAAFEGGAPALEQLLVDRIAAYGGEVRADDVVEEIALQGRRVRMIRLAGREAYVGCDFLLAGVESHCLQALLVEDGRSVREDLLGTGGLEHAGFVMEACCTLRGEAIPEPMASNFIALFDEGKPFGEGNLVWGEMDGPRGAGGAGTVRLCLRYLVDRERAVADLAYSRELLDAVVGRLGAVIPFLAGFLVECRDPLEGLRTAYELEDPLLAISRRAPSVYRLALPGQGFFRGLGHRTPLKNVIRANTEVCPSLGEEGLWLAALGAARIVTSQRKGKLKLRRRVFFG